MSADMDRLRYYVGRRYAPQVIVVPSDLVQQRWCESNPGALLDTFNHPSCASFRAHLKWKGPNDLPCELHEVNLKWNDLASLSSQRSTWKTNVLERVLRSFTQEHFGIANGVDAPYILSLASKDLATPWYCQLFDEFFRHFGASDYEFFEHPSLLLFIVTGEEDGSTVSRMAEETRGVLKTMGVSTFVDMDGPNVLLHSLYLFDTLPSRDDLDAKKTEMKSALDGGLGEALYMPISEDISNDSAFSAVVRWAGALATATIIPHLQSRAAILQEEVNQSRRGFVNSVSSALGFNFRRQKHKASKDTKLEKVSDSTTRRLADMCFELGIYEHAGSIYRHLASDTKSVDPRLYAGALEMQGVCSLLLDTVKEAVGFLEAATKAYHMAGMSFHALRSAALLSEVLKARKDYVNASLCLSQEANRQGTMMIAALCMEQAALCLGAVHSLDFTRKKSLLLLIAANRYEGCHLDDHAYRCYVTAYAHFAKSQWSAIGDHLLGPLGRISARLALFEESRAHIFDLLRLKGTKGRYHASYLRLYLSISANLSTLPFSVPWVDHERVQLLVADTSLRGTMAELEKRMVERIGGKKDVMIAGERVKAVQDEMIVVEVCLENPLQIPIQLTGLRLLIADDEGETYPQDVLIDRGQTMHIHLKCACHSPGTIAIVGLAGFLCGVLWCEERFSPALQANLTVEVVPRLAHIQLEMDTFPGIILQGELTAIGVKMKNFGTVTAERSWIGCSHPSMVIYDEEVGESVGGGRTAHVGDVSCVFDAYPIPLWAQRERYLDPSIVGLDRMRDMEPGEEREMGLWVKVGREGEMEIEFLYAYETNGVIRFIPVRRKVSVKRSVVSHVVSLNPSSATEDSYVLAIETTNIGTATHFTLSHIASLSGEWQVIPLACDGSVLLQPGHTAAMFFKVERRGTTSLQLVEMQLAEEPLPEVTMPFLQKVRQVEAYEEQEEVAQRRKEWLFAHKQMVEDVDMETIIPQRFTANQLARELNMALMWKTSGGNHAGISPLYDIPMRFSDRIQVAKRTPPSSAFIVFTMDHPAIVTATAFPVSVPITLTIFNMSDVETLAFDFEALHPDSTLMDHRAGQASKKFMWIGCTKRRCTSLPPLTSIQVHLTAAFATAGCYDLNRYRCIMRNNPLDIARGDSSHHTIQIGP